MILAYMNCKSKQTAIYAMFVKSFCLKPYFYTDESINVIHYLFLNIFTSFYLSASHNGKNY